MKRLLADAVEDNQRDRCNQFVLCGKHLPKMSVFFKDISECAKTPCHYFTTLLT